MKKEFASKKNNFNLLSDDINISLDKSNLKTFFKKFQDKLNNDIIKYKKSITSDFNEFQTEVKETTEVLKEHLDKSSQTYKTILNGEYMNENRDIIIQFFDAQCDLLKNIYYKQLNAIRKERIPKLQTDSDNVLKSIDELYITNEEELKPFISIESKEYKINITEPLQKFKDEMNFLLNNFISKIKNIMNSFQDTFLSKMVSFEHEMNDYIRFGSRNNIQSNKCRT